MYIYTYYLFIIISSSISISISIIIIVLYYRLLALVCSRVQSPHRQKQTVCFSKKNTFKHDRYACVYIYIYIYIYIYTYVHVHIHMRKSGRQVDAEASERFATCMNILKLYAEAGDSSRQPKAPKVRDVMCIIFGNMLFSSPGNPSHKPLLSPLFQASRCTRVELPCGGAKEEKQRKQT